MDRKKIKLDNSMITVKENTSTKGLCAYFKYKDLEFYADLCFIPFVNKNQFSVYQAKNNEVISWNELFTIDDVKLITKENVLKCIEEFKRTI